MEMIEKVIDRLNNSCFAELLNVDSITDISYNGEKIYYLDNFKGRQLYDKKIEYDEIRMFFFADGIVAAAAAISVIWFIIWLLGTLLSFIGMFKNPNGGAICGFVVSISTLMIALIP